MPTFPTKQEQMEAERRAAEQAREIESSEGYRERINVENNPEVDEESKFSSVHRPQSESASSTQSGCVSFFSFFVVVVQLMCNTLLMINRKNTREL